MKTLFDNYIKPLFGDIKVILIIVLIIIILLMRNCSGNSYPSNKIGDKNDTIITSISVKHDTVKTTIVNYVPKWNTKTEIKIDTFEIFRNSKVDTLEILKDYYSKYFYKDTLKIDTVGYVVVNDTISKNSILSRNVTTNIIIPTTTINKEILINKREFYIGTGIGGNIQPVNLNNISLEFLYRNKKRQAFGIGIGLNQQLSPTISGKIYWRIGK